MKTKILINNKEVEIELTPEQVSQIKRSNFKYTDIKTFDDALQAVGETLEAFNNRTALDSPDEKAFKQIKIIAKALNEDWEPDWDNSDYKYYPWFKLSSSGVGFSFYGYYCDHSDSFVGSRLVFKSKDLAIYAGKQFTSIYKTLFTL